MCQLQKSRVKSGRIGERKSITRQQRERVHYTQCNNKRMCKKSTNVQLVPVTRGVEGHLA